MAAINFPSGFIITSKDPIDSRLILTKNQMKNINFQRMPDLYFCLCSDDNRLYIFDSSIPEEEEDPLTGCFRPIENFFKYDSTEAKEKFEDAIKASAEISSIKDTLGDAEERTGVFAEIDAAETKITNVTTSVNALETKVNDELEPKVETLDTDLKDLEPRVEQLDLDIKDLEPEVEQAKEDIEDIQTWIQNVRLDGGEIRATYTLTTILAGVTLDSEDKSIYYKVEKTFEFDPNEGYTLPATVKINDIPVGEIDTDCGTTIASWTRSTYDEGKPYGRLILKDTTNNVTCEIVATEEV